MRLQILVLSLATLMLVAACEQDDPIPIAGQPEVTEEPVLEEEEVMPVEPPAETSLERAVEVAREDLAERTGAGTESIRVVDARRVTWPDGALGCPEEGMMYTQALVEGMYIVLAVDGEPHAYHAGRDGVPFACPPDRSRTPPDTEAPVDR